MIIMMLAVLLSWALILLIIPLFSGRMHDVLDATQDDRMRADSRRSTTGGEPWHGESS